jgi:hypothetical protein
MRAMKDPQRWQNKFFSQMQDIIASNAKGGILAEAGAFANQAKAEEDWARTDKIVWTNPGALSGGKPKIIPRESAGMPAGLNQMMVFAADSIRSTTGISVEMLGLAERTQPGVVEQSRIGQGMIILSDLFNNLRRYRKEQGRVLLHLMRLYIPEGKLVRITNSKYAPFVKSDDAVKFDIVVDQSPTAPNQKQEVWMALREIIPTLVKEGFPIPPDVIDFLPLPDSVIEKFKQFYASKAPSAEEQQMAHLQKIYELKGLAADAALKAAQATAVLQKAGAALKGVDARILETIVGALTESEKTRVEARAVGLEAGKAILSGATDAASLMIEHDKNVRMANGRATA